MAVWAMGVRHTENQGLVYQYGRSPLPHEQEAAAVAAYSFRTVKLAVG